MVLQEGHFGGVVGVKAALGGDRAGGVHAIGGHPDGGQDEQDEDGAEGATEEVRAASGVHRVHRASRVGGGGPPVN